MQAPMLYVIRQWPSDKTTDSGKLLGVYDSQLLAQNTLAEIMQVRQEDLGGKFVTSLDSSGQRIYSIEDDMHYSITPMIVNAPPIISRLSTIQARLKLPRPAISSQVSNVVEPQIIGPITVANIAAHQARLRRIIDAAVNQMLQNPQVIKSIYAKEDDDATYGIIDEALKEILVENYSQHRLDLSTEYAYLYQNVKVLELMVKADPTYGTQRNGIAILENARRELAYAEDPTRLIA